MIARLTDTIRQGLRNGHRFLMRSVLHADDPPDRLALGAAIGMFVAFTPTFGFQMALAVFIAWLLRANKTIGLPIVWISNPGTMALTYYGCYTVGCWLLGTERIWQAVMTRWRDPASGWTAAIAILLQEGGPPFLLGCLAVAICTAVPTYYVTYHAICWYRLRRWGQLVPPTRNRSAKID